MYCDLHTHSTYSDGTFSPAQLISEAKKLGLTVALTDHNTVSGLPAFMAEAERQGVTAVPGIELSTVYDKKELHLLGLFIAPEYYAAVEQLAKENLRLKQISNAALVEKLRTAGYRIDYDAIQRQNPNGNTNRAHIAAALMEMGYVESIREAFDTLLNEGNGFYEPLRRLQLTDGIRFLRQIHALPILAHPLKDLSESALRALLPEAINAGLLGIETHHSAYSREQTRLAAQIAEEFHLLPSGGSDFHGTIKPQVHLGCPPVPLEFYEKLLYHYKKSGTDAADNDIKYIFQKGASQ